MKFSLFAIAAVLASAEAITKPSLSVSFFFSVNLLVRQVMVSLLNFIDRSIATDMFVAHPSYTYNSNTRRPSFYFSNILLCYFLLDFYHRWKL
jgi:hypothetical protein